MVDVRFDYGLLQELIGAFESTRSRFEGLAGSLCPSCASDDPVAEHHVSVVKGQEDILLCDAVMSFTYARDGAQDSYDAFKAADGAVGGE
ncbi:hypothetical protein A7979_04775 [Rothia nasimurium]|uniref:Uncharacterized protein n=1 Tax=Rothia nasimurium TaxID=85336 RepID=A0A1Y1RMX3_9MICC|nr:hypothetical protein A7979_04775 [Rothia nasimurium]